MLLLVVAVNVLVTVSLCDFMLLALSLLTVFV
jgi:hypothetical protein